MFIPLLALWLSQSAAPALPSDIPATARHYSVLMGGNPAGQQAIWTASDGSLHVFFQFNDRGRGPQLYTVLKLDTRGVPVSETVTGHNYLKSSVHEMFAQAAAVAQWKSDSEQGNKQIAAPAFYAAVNSAPAESALLAKAALANGGRIGLLPDGEASITRVTDVNLESHGQTMHVTLYAIGGLDFSPNYVWLDDQSAFFAIAEPFMTVIPEGWEASATKLQTAVEQAAEARSRELAAKLAHPAPNGIAFTHARLFDAASATLIDDQTVVITGNRIRDVRASSTVKTPTAAQVIDARGKTLLPGLWDMHAHVGDNDGLLNLAAGVTTVRDLGNDIDTLLARRTRIEQGTEIGTRIVLAGLIDGPGPYQGPTKVLVSTPQQARAAVDNYARLGYVQIKIYSSVKPELVPAIIDEAHKHGLRVSGHIPAEMTAAECVKLGYNEIQHVNFLMLNFMPDVRNTNTPTRFTEVAKRGADLDLNSLEVQAFIKLLQDHHTALDPTLAIFEEMFETPPGQVPPGLQRVASRLPAQVRRGLVGSGLTPPPGMEQRYRQSFTKMVELIGRMYRAGIPIEDGTDSMAGFTLERELELDVQAGIPPAKVLQDATLNAARIMKLDKELGSIATGKLADLTLIDGNPVANISDIRRTALVVKNGSVYKPQELYSALGVVP